MNSKIFATEDDKRKAEALRKEFDEKLHEHFGGRYYVDILRSAEIPPAPNKLLPIYPHFCETVPYSVELQECIEGTVKELFRNDLSESEKKKPGLLLGKIQSGKTRAFVGCMALAFDQGVDACIILTKGTNALVDQTVKRMKKDFIDCSRNASPKRYATVAIYDIMDKREGLSRSLIEREKNVFVAKKEDDNMNALLEVFLESDLRNKKILIIDDEADFVSVSFSKDCQGDVHQGVVASRINELLASLPNCRYLQVTATPYSLYLQPNDSVELSEGRVMPFRPRFTSIVPIYREYVGSEQYFVLSQLENSMFRYLYHEVDPDCVRSMTTDKKSVEGRRINRKVVFDKVDSNKKIYDLRWALMHYLTASAIRQLQEEACNHGLYRTSFVMHVGSEKDDHKWEASLVKALLECWVDVLKVKSDKTNAFLQLFDDVYRNLIASIDAAKSDPYVAKRKEKILEIPDQKNVLKKVLEILVNDDYNVQLVNSDQNIFSMLDDDGQLELTHAVNLFIGGSVLDRGITIAHMLGFFYGREPQVKQQASVLQHCRMYGNRSLNDMAVTRLFSQKSLYDVMKKVNDMDDLMRSKFEKTVNDPNADPSIEFVLHDKRNGIIPCGPSALILSKTIFWKPDSYIFPIGQQTISPGRKLNGIVDAIQNALNQGVISSVQISENKLLCGEQCVEIDTDTAIQMVEQTVEQFEYKTAWENLDYKWDGSDIITMMRRLLKGESVIPVFVKNKHGYSRKRSKAGCFMDAPIDGRHVSPTVKEYAEKYGNKPVLVMLQNSGDCAKGWRGAPFFWPVLYLPKNMECIVYSQR